MIPNKNKYLFSKKNNPPFPIANTLRVQRPKQPRTWAASVLKGSTGHYIVFIISLRDYLSRISLLWIINYTILFFLKKHNLIENQIKYSSKLVDVCEHHDQHHNSLILSTPTQNLLFWENIPRVPISHASLTKETKTKHNCCSFRSSLRVIIFSL